MTGNEKTTISAKEPEKEIESCAVLIIFFHEQSGKITPKKISLKKGEGVIVFRDRTFQTHLQSELVAAASQPDTIATMAFFAIVLETNASLLISNHYESFGVRLDLPQNKRQIKINYHDQIGEVAVVGFLGKSQPELDDRIDQLIDQRIAYLAKQQGIN